MITRNYTNNESRYRDCVKTLYNVVCMLREKYILYISKHTSLKRTFTGLSNAFEPIIILILVNGEGCERKQMLIHANADMLTILLENVNNILHWEIIRAMKCI